MEFKEINPITFVKGQKLIFETLKDLGVFEIFEVGAGYFKAKQLDGGATYYQEYSNNKVSCSLEPQR